LGTIHQRDRHTHSHVARAVATIMHCIRAANTHLATVDLLSIMRKVTNLGRFDANEDLPRPELGIHVIVLFDVVYTQFLCLDDLVFPETPALSLVNTANKCNIY